MTNIISGKEGNFKKCEECDNQGIPYDTGSVMHYHEKQFSKNGELTIVAKDGSEIGQKLCFLNTKTRIQRRRPTLNRQQKSK